MNAKISLRHPAVPAIKRDIVALVRLDGQGYASVELYVPSGTIYAGRLGSWRTLAEVIRHPAVVAVTFPDSPVDPRPNPEFSEDIRPPRPYGVIDVH